MSLEEAQRIVAEHQRTERVRQADAKRHDLVGHYFKTRNSYGSDGSWWLYGAVTAVSEWGYPEGWTFQRKGDGFHDEFEVNARASLLTVESWQEISRDEFAVAAAQFMADQAAMLALRLPEASR